jgi:hypothetical protein
MAGDVHTTLCVNGVPHDMPLRLTLRLNFDDDD